MRLVLGDYQFAWRSRRNRLRANGVTSLLQGEGDGEGPLQVKRLLTSVLSLRLRGEAGKAGVLV